MLEWNVYDGVWRRGQSQRNDEKGLEVRGPASAHVWLYVLWIDGLVPRQAERHRHFQYSINIHLAGGEDLTRTGQLWMDPRGTLFVHTDL